MKVRRVVVGALETNCYLVYSEDTLECIIVDPGADSNKIIQEIESNNLKPTVIINTHAHVDHIGANKIIKEKFDIPLYIHKADFGLLKSALQLGFGMVIGAKKSPPPDRFLKEGDILKLGKSQLTVIHTPGHSPGSISLLGEGFILSGDALFQGGVGRTDLPGGSWDELQSSIRNKILNLPSDTLIFPGHGPSTKVSFEKKSNPYLT